MIICAVVRLHLKVVFGMGFCKFTVILPAFLIGSFAICMPPTTATSSAEAAYVQAGNFISIKELANEYEIASQNMHLRVAALSPDVIRIRYALTDKFSERSFVVQNPSARIKLRMQQDNDYVRFDTDSLKLRVNKHNLCLQIADKNDHVILEDSAPVTFRGDSFDVSKISPLDEHYFGLGDKSGPLDHRNQAYCFWNTDPPLWQESTDPMYKSVPFLLALRNGASYGIYLDNTYRAVFDLCKSRRDTLSFGAEAGPLDYYFFYGPTPKKVIEEYTGLVGRMPLPPMFSLGYQQSRGSYIPDAAVREVASELRKHKIPCDVIYLDGDYKQDSRPFTVDKVKFPDFSGTLHELAANGFKTVISLDPYIAKFNGDKNFEEGASKGYFLKKPNGDLFLGKVWTASLTSPVPRSEHGGADYINNLWKPACEASGTI